MGKMGEEEGGVWALDCAMNKSRGLKTRHEEPHQRYRGVLAHRDRRWSGSWRTQYSVHTCQITQSCPLS